MKVLKLRPEEYYNDGIRKVNLWSLVKAEDFFEDVQGAALKVTKEMMEGALERMRDETIEAGRHERTEGRKDYRNGYYVRKWFETAIGVIRDLRVPRCRKRRLVRELRELMAQAKGAVEEKVVEMFLRGVSTRNVGELLDGLLGISVSSGRVSQLARRLDGEVRRFHERALGEEYKYLFLDGVHLKSRSAPRLFQKMSRARRRVVLVAYGVTFGGVKELIGFRLERSETAAGWRRFLLGLHRRGLASEKVELVVTDGGKGLLEAIDDCFPEAKHQRCWFHKMSNVVQKVRVRNQAACLRGLRKVYQAESRRAAERAYGAWARRWVKEEPEAVRCVEKDLDALLVFIEFPKEHWKMIRTTNGIERCFREVRRRTRSIGCFINEASLERIIYGLFRFMNEKRAGKMCKEFKAVLKANQAA